MEIKTIAWKIHIVHPPKSSKLPNPKAVAANAIIGKQQGDSKTVRRTPEAPNLSKLFANLMLFKYTLNQRNRRIFRDLRIEYLPKPMVLALNRNIP